MAVVELRKNRPAVYTHLPWSLQWAVQQNLLHCPKSSLALPRRFCLSVDTLMELGFGKERIAFLVSLAWQDMPAYRIPKCQPSSNYDLGIQDGDFNITNVHGAHAAMDPFRQRVIRSSGNIMTWTTAWKLHSFVNSTLSWVSLIIPWRLAKKEEYYH